MSPELTWYLFPLHLILCIKKLFAVYGLLVLDPYLRDFFFKAFFSGDSPLYQQEMHLSFLSFL
uniref:Uncharacterized protein n=1 Tax=Rhizophora mucronata TaxID=61149 RepID=A0A2P2PL31_RHIMU